MRKQPRKRCDHCQQFSKETSMDLVTLPISVMKYDFYGVAVCDKCGTSYSDEYWLNWLCEKGWDKPVQEGVGL